MRIKKRTRPTDFGASPRETFAEPGLESDDPAFEELEHLELDNRLSGAVQRPAVSSAITATPLRPPARQTVEAYADAAPDAFRPPSAWPLYLIALVVAVLWSLAPIAFALGYRGGVAPFHDDSLPWWSSPSWPSAPARSCSPRPT